MGKKAVVGRLDSDETATAGPSQNFGSLSKCLPEDFLEQILYTSSQSSVARDIDLVRSLKGSRGLKIFPLQYIVVAKLSIFNQFNQLKASRLAA